MWKSQRKALLHLNTVPHRPGVKYGIVLDTKKVLCSINLAWCIWANQEDQKVEFALFESIYISMVPFIYTLNS